MNIFCPTCDSGILAENVDIIKGEAKCQQCATVFSLSTRLPLSRPDVSYKAREMPTPAGVIVDDNGDQWQLRIQLRKTVGYKLYLFIGIVMLGVGYFMFILPTIDSARINNYFLLMVCAVCFTAGAVFMLLYGLVVWTGTTSIYAEKDMLYIKTSPLAALSWKNRRFLVEDIGQVFIRQDLSEKRNDKPFYKYHVDFLNLADNRTAPLVKELKQHEVAIFIETFLEKKLGIEDNYVSGEYHPDHPSSGGGEEMVHLLKKIREARKQRKDGFL